MKILVTGASGFIGGAIVERLAKNELDQIIAMGRSACTRFDSYRNVIYKREDLSISHGTLQADICIHAAGLADDRSARSELNKHNVHATSLLLKRLVNCRQIIFISSASVYDFSDGHIKAESDTGTFSTLSAYGASKLLAEAFVKNAEMESKVIIRPRAVYGKGDRVLLPRIKRMSRFGKMIVPGNLKVNSSLTHIDNLGEAIAKVIANRHRGTVVLNIADANVYQLQKVFEEIGVRVNGSPDLLSLPLPVLRLWSSLAALLHIPSTLNKQSLDYLSQHAVLDIRQAQQLFGYQGTRTFFSDYSREISRS